MDRRGLKTVMILILLLTNAFLLAHLALRYAREEAARRQGEKNLLALLASGGVTVSALPREAPPDPVSLSGYDKLSDSAAAFFLGGHPEGTEADGELRYADGETEVRISPDGVFSVSGLESREDPQRLCRRFCRLFGFRLPESLEAEDGVLMAFAVYEGLPVENCRVSFLFAQGRLREVSGTLLPGEAVPSAYPGELRGAAAALTAFQFWEDRPQEAAVTAVSRCFLLETGEDGDQTLVPAWRIETETAAACVNCLTGEVSAA